MKVAVTGASGFIGTALLGVLKSRDNIDIVAISRNVTERNDCSEIIEWRQSDYSEESMSKVLADVDALIHLAGVRGTEDDASKFSVNETVTENILKAMVNTSVRRIVFASTVSVYDDENMIPWTEEAHLKGRTAYGDSKIRCEKLIEKYANKNGFSFALVRIAQVLGEGETRRGMMNVFIDTARSHGTLKVMGKSIAKRQYIFVKDLAEILSTLAAGSDNYVPDKNIVLNAGMERAYTNYEIAELVNKVYSNPTPICYEDSYPELNRAFCMNVSKLENELNFIPMDMEQALKEISMSN